MVSFIRDKEQVLAIVIPSTYDAPGCSFVTEHADSMQMAYMGYGSGKVIKPHVHKMRERIVWSTCEAIFIRRGVLRADIYTADQTPVTSVVLNAGDVILLLAGGHGFEVLEDVEMLEVKQGPFVPEGDKVHFHPA